MNTPIYSKPSPIMHLKNINFRKNEILKFLFEILVKKKSLPKKNITCQQSE